jgi:hypothetical protein
VVGLLTGQRRNDLSYHDLEIMSDGFVLTRNVLALASRDDFAGAQCDRADTQYTLLDPVGGEPVVLQSKLDVSFRDQRVILKSLKIEARDPNTVEGRVPVCFPCGSIEKIRERGEFGVPWYRGGKRTNVSGTADDHIEASLRAFLCFWRELDRALSRESTVPIETGERLSGILKLSRSERGVECHGKRRDIGSTDPFDYIKNAADQQ